MRKVFKKISALVCAVILTVGALGICSGCQSKLSEGEVSVYMPDGAPALALAGCMAEDAEEDGITYRVVKSDLIASKVTAKEEAQNADFCVMPLTAAAKLLGDGERYAMAGVVTHGNLYMISMDETPYTAQNLSALIGKKVGVLQLNNLPGLTFKAILDKYGVAWQVLTNEGGMVEDKVNLTPLADASAVDKTSDIDCYVLAEPAVSVQVKNKGFHVVGDLQALYNGENGYPQAVLVVKQSFLSANKKWTEEFIQKVQASAEWLKSATGEQIVAAVSAHMEDQNSATTLKAPLLTAEVLARCGVRYTPAKDSKTEVKDFLQAIVGVQATATAIPQDGFFIG
ncbi:MAG: ABC transporter substrate-binding protein [Clostridia bacterium]|nr:ABC transporter substrate-binding protein [Clostridia bacterium]